ncbi:MAG: DNA/RNA nuclease SfsA [Cellulosilyticaceae bacterium]
MIHYDNILEATFISRPNRFIAHCLVEGQEVIVHVKNTGRCKELLIPGVKVYLQHHDNPKRKTNYSLIAVEKGDRLINMDSQVTNKVCYEALKDGLLVLPDLQSPLSLIKGEYTYHNSRFDVYVSTEEEEAFVEVKGVTLEEEGVVRFPDAPTERGIKHIYELIDAVKEGYKAYILFVIQMEDVKYFSPNNITHKAFGDALIEAKRQGVHILAYDSIVKPDGIELNRKVEVRLVETESREE